MSPVRNFAKTNRENDISNGVKKIVIVAGDTSGDLYGGFLSKKLKEKYAKVEIYSFGGPALAEHSRQIINLLAHSVCGLIEVISSLKKILADFKKTLAQIRKINPDLIILIDFPDFNLHLAKRLNKTYPIFYYVSPQVWAWRKNRINLIKKFTNKMVVIFKFEEDFYKQNNMDVLYFGHPLLEIIKPTNLKPKEIISFLPGSRKNEIKKHLPIMKEAKKLIQERLPEYSFRIIKPESIERKFYEQFSPDMEVVNHSYQALEESKFIITSSGTATVEIAVLEVPYLIIYKMNFFSWQILKRMVKTKFVGMVNILAGKKVVDELIQEDAHPQRIAQITSGYLADAQKYNQLKENLRNVKGALSPYGASERFAQYLGEYLNLI